LTRAISIYFPPPDIEDRQAAYRVGVRERLPYFSQALPRRA
jgi:hypothetical protein